MKTTWNFYWHREKIQNYAKELRENGMDKAAMSGVHDSLIRLKKMIEDAGEEQFHGFYLDDAPFFGWSGEPLRNMYNIGDEINENLLRTYAVIMVGLGETELEEDK